MDHFGIGAGLTGAIDIYFRASRGTGRTTSLVDSVKEGDRVIFVSEKQAKEFERKCKERDLKVETMVCGVDDIDRLIYLRPHVQGEGRLIFDHVWVEQFYRHALDRSVKEIDRLQRELSGVGAAHRETARAAREFHQWRQ